VCGLPLGCTELIVGAAATANVLGSSSGGIKLATVAIGNAANAGLLIWSTYGGAMLHELFIWMFTI
jgi:phosphoribosylcarboxyaminoimidazole (NCAIR) mutase